MLLIDIFSILYYLKYVNKTKIDEKPGVGETGKRSLPASITYLAYYMFILK